jgi:hypothetical protein
MRGVTEIRQKMNPNAEQEVEWSFEVYNLSDGDGEMAAIDNFLLAYRICPSVFFVGSHLFWGTWRWTDWHLLDFLSILGVESSDSNRWFSPRGIVVIHSAPFHLPTMSIGLVATGSRRDTANHTARVALHFAAASGVLSLPQCSKFGDATCASSFKIWYSFHGCV